MRTFVALIFLILTLTLNAQKSAIVNIDFKSKKTTKISEYLFGTFIEFYSCFQNNGMGLYAQEFNNRGFDFSQDASLKIAGRWIPWNTYTNEDPQWKLIRGGYNENAIFYQKAINHVDSGSVGIGQYIFTTAGTGYDFYIYAKSENYIGNLNVAIYDHFGGNKIFEDTLGRLTKDWKKYEAVLPEVSKDLYEILIVIKFEGKGEIDFDEASIMPSNNIDGVRKYHFDAYKRWAPTILWYPGGWFVEYSGYTFDMAYGHIDKRPVKEKMEIVRLDFGIDEFMKFCRNLNIEPHVTLSYLNNSVQDFLNQVEYLNGPADSEYGSLRAKNGHAEPYNVKYYEIGNEIWEIPVQYSHDYNVIYDKLKDKYPDIISIVSGDIWHGDEFLDTEISIMKEKSEIYGWHWAQSIRPKEPATDDEIYYSSVCGSTNTQGAVDQIQRIINKYNLSKHIKQGITELWTVYNSDAHDWDFDTTVRAGSLENGLWLADQMITFINNAEYVDIVEKTAALATIRYFVKPGKERVFYTVPSYHANVIINSHHGNYLLPTSVSCDLYSQRSIKGLNDVINAPMLNVCATVDKDTLYLYVLNKEAHDSMTVFFNFNQELLGTTSKIYRLCSESYLDANTPEDTENIKIQETQWEVEKNYKFPPHSFYAFAIPYKNDTSIDISTDYVEKIYPNPVSEDLNIIYNNYVPESIYIYDNLGQLVLKPGRDEISIGRIKLGNLSTGLYFMNILINNKNEIYKIIVN